jgi:H+/Cl- antiporter ClcA
MDGARILLVLASVALVAILVRALFAGNIHSNYAVTYRDENPGAFWALWIVLLLPLIPILLVVMKLHPATRH